MAEIKIDLKPNKNTAFLWGEVFPAATRPGNLLRWVILEGSSRSGKTWAVLQFLIVLCLRPELLGKHNILVRVYRNDATTTTGTVVDDFIEIMNEIFGGLDDGGQWLSLFRSAGTWNKTLKKYTFSNGSVIQFHGANDAQKIQGKKATISWLNEAMEILDKARRQIATRTELFVLCDFNPSETDHWLFDSVMTNPDWFLYCHSTFNDNRENLTPQQIYEIECTRPTPENIARGTANSRFWDVYGLGKRGVREGQVFPRIHWDLCDYYPEPTTWQRHGYGLDYGYSQDPSTLIECALVNDCLYLREVFYERGLIIGRNSEDYTLPSIQGRMEEARINKLTKIVADSARADSNAFLRACGFNVVPCVKGKDSINYGLSLMKQFRIYILRSSQNVQREFENYHYTQRPNGEFTDDPADKNNHAIDAVRYWTTDNLRPRAFMGHNLKPIKGKSELE